MQWRHLEICRTLFTPNFAYPVLNFLSVDFNQPFICVHQTFNFFTIQHYGVLTKRFRDTAEGESYIFKYQFNSKQYPEHTLVMHYDEGEGFMGDIEDAYVNELGD